MTFSYLAIEKGVYLSGDVQLIAALIRISQY